MNTNEKTVTFSYDKDGKVSIDYEEYAEITVKAEVYNLLYKMGYVPEYIKETIDKKIIQLKDNILLSIQPQDDFLH